MTTEQILNHIREVCGLKYLPEHDGDTVYYLPEHDGDTVYYLPVHLEHLLYAVREKGSDICISPDGTMIDLDTSNGYEITYKVLPDYDLTKTVEQNLNDNAKLRELIISLIK